MAATMIIRNGYVFDPLNEINGDIKDIFIKDGKVVSRSLRSAKRGMRKSSMPPERPSCPVA